MPKGNGKLFGGLAVFAVVIIAAVFLLLQYGVPQTTAPTSPGGSTPQATSEFCANNPSVDLDIRLKNALNASADYENNTILVVDKSGSSQKIKSFTGGGSSSYTTISNAITCGHAVDIYARSSVDDDNGGFITSLTEAETMQDPVLVDGEYTDVGKIRARIWDYDEGAFIDDNQDDTKNDYENLASTPIKFYSTTTNTSKTVGADGCLDYRIDLKTQSVDTQFGLKTLMGIDLSDSSNSNDWDEETVVVKYEGTEVDEIKSSMSEDDKDFFSGFELVYDLGEAIPDQSVSVDLYMCSGGGVNPDYNSTMFFAGTGIYTDDNDPNTLIGSEDGTVVARTDTSNTAIITATNQKLSLTIV